MITSSGSRIRPESRVLDVSPTGMLDGALQIAGTLAWALPAPWGPVAAAATTLFELLLGGASSADPLQVAVQALENYIQSRDINQWGRTVDTFIGGTNGLNSQTAVLKQTISASQTEFIQTLLKTIDDATEAGTSVNVYAAANSLRDAVGQLVTTAAGQSREDYFNSKAPSIEDTLDLAILAASALLLAMKLRIQLYATLGSLADSAKNAAQLDEMTGAWLDAYDTYRINIQGVQAGRGLVGLTTALLNTTLPVRKSLVGECFEVQYDDSGVITNAFVDAAFEDPYYENGELIHDDQNFANYNADLPTLQNMRAQYLANIDARFANRLNAVNAWTASITEWSSHLPPTTPTVSPSVAQDAKWTSSRPQPPNWLKGNAVAYAVAWKNSNGPSAQGPFSDWIEIDGLAFPMVTVPTDPLAMAQARLIYRKFRAQPGSSELVAIIPDNKTTTFVDSKL